VTFNSLFRERAVELEALYNFLQAIPTIKVLKLAFRHRFYALRDVDSDRLDVVLEHVETLSVDILYSDEEVKAGSSLEPCGCRTYLQRSQLKLAEGSSSFDFLLIPLSH